MVASWLVQTPRLQETVSQKPAGELNALFTEQTGYRRYSQK